MAKVSNKACPVLFIFYLNSTLNQAKWRLHKLMGRKLCFIHLLRQSSKATTSTVTIPNVNNLKLLNTITMRSPCWLFWSFHKKIPKNKSNSKLKSSRSITNASMKESREDNLSFSTDFLTLILWLRHYTSIIKWIFKSFSPLEDSSPKTKNTTKLSILMTKCRRPVHLLKEWSV